MDYENKLVRDFINSLIGKKVSIKMFENPDVDRYSFMGILTEFRDNAIIIRTDNTVLIDLDNVVAIMDGWLD